MDYIIGRGAQINPNNKFERITYSESENDYLWEGQPNENANPKTEYIKIFPKKIINEVVSPDIGAGYSLNPYQGCEHGCIYCYARNSHEFLGFSAGLDFETKILVKVNAAELLRKEFKKKKWEPKMLMLSGNTDCYQPIERKLKITREILEVCLEYNHPVGIITKNSLILRDIDILRELGKLNLLRINISINSLNEKLKTRLEPRTASTKSRLHVVKKLSEEGISVNVLIAPLIPSLNAFELLNIMKVSSEAGAITAKYIVVRLNGKLDMIFKDWLKKNYPDRADKIYSQIKEFHGGQVNDSRYGIRMSGEGNHSRIIRQMYKVGLKKYYGKEELSKIDYNAFHKKKKYQLDIFG